MLLLSGQISVALTQDLDKLSVKQLLSNATQDIRTLIDVHSNEGKPLVEEHLTHVACETEPIVMGRYLLRMPPMVGGGSIAVPHLFLAQIYSASIAFGCALNPIFLPVCCDWVLLTLPLYSFRRILRKPDFFTTIF